MQLLGEAEHFETHIQDNFLPFSNSDTIQSFFVWVIEVARGHFSYSCSV
jgi:hypothetical protein